MGGKALKDYGAARGDTLVFSTVATTMVRILNELGIPNRVPKWLIDKSDFGDVDILVAGPVEGAIDAVRDLFEYKTIHVVKNGPVTSLGFPLDGLGRPDEVFQVDLIQVDVDELDFAACYFSWGDLGNLIGRIAHKFGVKLGHDGLWAVIRNGTHVYGEILLTRNFEDALRALGYDPMRFKVGFHIPEDVYQYTTETEFFNPDIFLLQNRNHISRVRDRKRPLYMGFLQWIEERKAEGVQFCHFHFPADKGPCIEEFIDAFGKRAEYDALLENVRISKEASKIFSGSVVKEVTGLEGIGLGKAMGFLRSSVEPFNQGPRAVIDFVEQGNDISARIRSALRGQQF